MKIIFLSLFLLPFSVLCQTGPGGVGKNDGTSTLKLWLDADKGLSTDFSTVITPLNGNRITFWRDLSGNMNHATISNPNQRPTFIDTVSLINNKGVLLFHNDNGWEDSLNIMFSGGLPTTVGMSIFIVFHPLQPGAGTNSSFTGGSSFDHWYNGAGILDASKPGFQNDFGISYCSESMSAGLGSTSGTKYTAKRAATVNQTYTLTLIRSATSGNIQLWKNGGGGISYPTHLNPVDATSRLAIGGLETEPGTIENYFHGYIAHIIAFSSTVNAAQKVIVENFLASKYGLPTTYDYYTMDDPINGNFDNEVAGIGKFSDGTTHIDSKGDGIIRLYNPDNIDLNEFLFWGNDNKPMIFSSDFNSADPYFKKLERTWRVSEYGGEIGNTVMEITLEGYTELDVNRICILIDKNNNGSFKDDPTGIIKGASYIGNNVFRFNSVNLNDQERFTIALSGSFEDHSQLVISPNGDGLNDEFYIQEQGEIKIFTKEGKLVKKLFGPSIWNGTNEKGEPAGTGFYLIQVDGNEKKFYEITVIE